MLQLPIIFVLLYGQESTDKLKMMLLMTIYFLINNALMFACGFVQLPVT